ncbi:unnamed protein product [Camellia sinensis]
MNWEKHNPQMDISSSKACFLLSLPLFFNLCFGNSLSYLNTSSSHNNLIYSHCPNQTFNDPKGSLQQILSSLFQELVDQSSRSKFYQTSTGDEKIAISGLFQCRIDLSNGDCHDCVSGLPDMSSGFCGKAIPARIHLSGCYLNYKADGFETSWVQLQHKTCSESKADSSGFVELRDAAFAALESNVVSSANGFIDMTYESMHMVAQCGGNLEGCECGGCVNNAVQIAQDECGNSLSGEVYLDSCFISYSSNDNNGIPGNSNQGNETNQISTSSGRLVAIVLGGAAALLFVFMFFYFYRSSKRKSDEW